MCRVSGVYAQRAFGSFHNDQEFGEVVWRFAPEAVDRTKRFVFHPLGTHINVADVMMAARQGCVGFDAA